MKRAVKILLAIIVSLIMVASLSMTVLAASTTYNVKVPVQYGQTEARKMLGIINDFRTGKDAWYWNSDNQTKTKCKNLKKLQYDYNLEKIAMQRAAEIALFTNHVRPNGTSFFSLFNWEEYTYGGENIAWYSKTAKAAFNNLKEDAYKFEGQGHRRSMLSSDFTSIGIGHVVYNGMHYWVQEFGNNVVTPNKTSADNSKRNVQIEVAKDKIKIKSVTPSTKKVEVVYEKKASLPSITSKVQANGSWVSGTKPVKVVGAWKVKDTSIAEIVNNQLVGKKPGKTTLTTTALGKRVSVEVVVKCTTTPKIKKVTTKKKKVTLTWNQIKEANGYEIYMAISKKGTYKKVKTISKNTTTTYTKSKLKRGKTYYFKMRAYRKIGNKTYYSDYSKVSKIKVK